MSQLRLGDRRLPRKGPNSADTASLWACPRRLCLTGLSPIEAVPAECGSPRGRRLPGGASLQADGAP
eukprot:7365958-Alexandrium_andersonii.AAC.1